MTNRISHINHDLEKRLLAGEEAALKQVFRLYYPRLHYFAFNALGNHMDAEDIVQDVIINFWVAIKEKGEFQGSIQAYLYRSVRNRCLNHLQRQEMLAGKSAEIIEKFYSDEQRRLDELAIKQELYHQVSQEFNSLTPIQIKIMQLLYIEGLSVAEIAAKLQITANNVRNHRARAMDRLKTIMKNQSLPLILLFLLFILNLL